MTEPYVHKPPHKINASKAASLLGDPDTPGLVILTIALWTFGPAVFGDDELGVERMDVSELWAGLNEHYGTWVSEEGENRLNALMMAMESDLFYTDLEVFDSVVNALFDGDLGDLVNGVFDDRPSTLEVMWAVLEVQLAREDRDGTPQFAPSVLEYIQESLVAEQEDHTDDEAAVQDHFRDMLDMLRSLGVPIEAIRLYDSEYSDVIEFLEANSGSEI